MTTGSNKKTIFAKSEAMKLVLEQYMQLQKDWHKAQPFVKYPNLTGLVGYGRGDTRPYSYAKAIGYKGPDWNKPSEGVYFAWGVDSGEKPLREQLIEVGLPEKKLYYAYVSSGIYVNVIGWDEKFYPVWVPCSFLMAIDASIDQIEAKLSFVAENPTKRAEADAGLHCLAMDKARRSIYEILKLARKDGLSNKDWESLWKEVLVEEVMGS